MRRRPQRRGPRAHLALRLADEEPLHEDLPARGPRARDGLRGFRPGAGGSRPRDGESRRRARGQVAARRGGGRRGLQLQPGRPPRPVREPPEAGGGRPGAQEPQARDGGFPDPGDRPQGHRADGRGRNRRGRQARVHRRLPGHRRPFLFRDERTAALERGHHRRRCRLRLLPARGDGPVVAGQEPRSQEEPERVRGGEAMKAKLGGVCLIAAALATPAVPPAAAEDRTPTAISDIRQENTDRSTRVIIECTGPLAYTYYSPDALTLVVDMPEVDASKVPARINVATREVESLRVTNLARADGRNIARLEVRLASLVPYQIYSKGKALNLVFDRPAAAAAAVAPAPAPAAVAQTPAAAPDPLPVPAARTSPPEAEPAS